MDDKLKKPKKNLSGQIVSALPMLEEISEKKFAPIAILSCDENDNFYLATVSDANYWKEYIEKAIIEIGKQLQEKHQS